jgi:hypothetical protein
MFQVFHLFFQIYVAKFHLDVLKVDRMLHAAVRLLLSVRPCGSRAGA